MFSNTKVFACVCFYYICSKNSHFPGGGGKWYVGMEADFPNRIVCETVVTCAYVLSVLTDVFLGKPSFKDYFTETFVRSHISFEICSRGITPFRKLMFVERIVLYKVWIIRTYNISWIPISWKCMFNKYKCVGRMQEMQSMFLDLRLRVPFSIILYLITKLIAYTFRGFLYMVKQNPVISMVDANFVILNWTHRVLSHFYIF